MHKTFMDFIRANADRDDPVGDYCVDTLRHLKITPLMPRLKKDFYSMVRFKDECVIEAFNEAWGEYWNG